MSEVKLTVKQERVLSFLRTFLQKAGYPPTVREISNQLNLSGPNSAKKYLDILERKGFIRKIPNSSRAIEILEPRKEVFTRMVPLVGKIQAGVPVLAVENIEKRIAVDSTIARNQDMFLLRVEGDSMIDSHILDGDLALIRPQETAEQGEIVAVMIDDEATVKHFYQEQNGIRLQPANSTMAPIIIQDDLKDVKIIGKVAGIIRTME